MPKAESKTKLGVTIMGAGRLGLALAIALSHRGYSIQSLVGRKRPRRTTTAALLDQEVELLAAKEITRVGDVVLVTTPDDQLPVAVHALSKVDTKGNRPPTVLHTSGAISSEILSSLAISGWQTGSIHPLISVSDPVEGSQALKGVHWCIEGDQKAIKVGRRIIRDLEGLSFTIKRDTKPLYHAAAVMTSGNVVALFAVAIDMLARCGLEQREAQRILVPLIQSTVTSLSAKVPAKALTGTFSRGDVATVLRHLKALSHKGLEHPDCLYRLLGLKSLELASDNGLPRTTNRRIAKLLKDQSVGN